MRFLYSATYTQRARKMPTHKPPVLRVSNPVRLTWIVSAGLAKKKGGSEPSSLSNKASYELVADRQHRTGGTSVVTKAEWCAGRVLLNHADLIVAERAHTSRL